MKKHNCIKALPFLLPMLLLTACEKDKLQPSMGIDFTATMEQPSSGDSKVQLVDERWIYWEPGDEISIGSNQTSANEAPASGFLTGVGQEVEDFGQFNGVFHTELPEGSTIFLALHPKSANNRIISGGGTDFTATISLPNEQPYRDDSTFAKQVLPMVAWYGDNWEHTVPNLDFHNLAGIVRLQFYNSTGQTFTINSINIASNQQLSGLFTVVDYKTYNPHLTSTSSADEDKQITLTMPDGGLTFEANALKSFYLVLPAMSGMDAGTNYSLTVTVNASQNSNNYSFGKSLTVPTRRNGITYTRAISIDAFSANTTTSVGLVGNGDAIRPFKIYTVADMQYLRDCFNSTPAKVNGQVVTAETEFRIMRSDIILDNTSWTSGIQNFKGHLTYYATAPNVSHGITNRSNSPIFVSISSDGVVEGLAVKCDAAISGAGIDDYSPFCRNNYGTIRGCSITTPTGGNTLDFRGVRFGGICHTNYANAKIIDCICTVRGLFTNNARVGGICYTNQNFGEISGCVAASPMQISGGQYLGGVCYSNAGQVHDCYTDIHYTSGNADWGGIVYSNVGTVEHSYVSQSAIIHSDNVGGIVCTNSGTVNYCWTHGELRGTCVGAIASTNSGRLVNCYVNDQLFIITLLASGGAHYAGGLVGVLNGGQIENCFVNINHVAYNDNTGVHGGLVGRITGSGNVINNCYAYELATTTHRIYGADDGTSTDFTRCYLVNGEQIGVTPYEVSGTDEQKETAVNTLKGNLKAASLPTNGKTWVRKTAGNGLDNMPYLEPYTLGSGSYPGYSE